MAVYTKVSSEEFRSLLGRYDIGELISYRGIAEGVQNTNYLLETDKGQYIFTAYEKWLETEDILFFLSAMEHLAKRGIPCPIPIHMLDGNITGNINNRVFAIVSFLKGTWPRIIKNHHCSEAGKYLAKMHLAFEDFPQKRNNPFSIESWSRSFEKVRHNSDKVRNGMAEEVDRALVHIKNNWPNSLPSGVIHADPFPDNMLFEGERLTGIIDFYLACNDFFAYDIAIALNAWCFESNVEFNITKARLLLSGYNSIKPLTKQEREALPILAYGAALNFLLNRMYDWLNPAKEAMVSAKDPIEYLQKLRFHARVRSVAEYGL